MLRALKGRQRGDSVPTPLPLKLGNPLLPPAAKFLGRSFHRLFCCVLLLRSHLVPLSAPLALRASFAPKHFPIQGAFCLCAKTCPRLPSCRAQN